mgnify:CR=1 FL=1
MTNEIPERFYRAVFATDLDRVLDPVASPQGRFHHTGQPALYLSETVNGVVTAMKTYLAAGDPTRVIVPLHLSARTILDARDAQTHRTLQTDPGAASMRWQDDRAAAGELGVVGQGACDRHRGDALRLAQAARSDPSRSVSLE